MQKTIVDILVANICLQSIMLSRTLSHVFVKVAKDLKHLCFFLKKIISRQREAPESASFNLIPITHNIKGFYVQICRRGSPGGEI